MGAADLVKFTPADENVYAKCQGRSGMTSNDSRQENRALPALWRAEFVDSFTSLLIYKTDGFPSANS
jgi:hypothetical protein